MKLVGKVPVEPLDDARLTNIERNLVVHVSEMSQHRTVGAPRRWLAFAGVAAAVALAGFIGWKLHRDPALPPAPAQQLAMKDGVLDLGDAQITGKDFEVTRTAARTDIVMRPGRIELHVDHQPGRLFVVKAGDVEIEDVGTRFSVDFDGKHVDVRVTEGEVKVKHAGKELTVKAGDAWDIEIGPITIAQLTAQQAAAANPNASAHAVVPAPMPNTNVVTPSANHSNGNAVGNGSGTKPSRDSSSDAKKALEKFPIEPLRPTSATNAEAAITDYLQQAKTMPSGADKDEVLQSLAVMYLRQKDHASASYMIKGILQRQGGDSDAFKEALWLDMRIKCLTSYERDGDRDSKADRKFDDACRLAAQRYLVKFPTQPGRSGIAQTVLNEISRGQ